MAQVPLNYGLAVEDGTGDPLRTAFFKIQSNLTDLDTRLTSATSVLALLGGAARLNVGITTGTVADGGALAAETTRATTAEQANATAIANETSRAQAAELLKAPIASPAFTGVPTAPTGTTGASSNQLATQAYVVNTIAAGGGGGGGGGGTGGVPPTRQLTAAGLVQGGGDLTTDRTFTVSAATQSDVATGTDQTKALTSYSVAAALGAKAPLASPAFVGFPTAPTAPAGTSSTVLATTGFVAASLLTKAGSGANTDITSLNADLLSSETSIASAATTDIGAVSTRRVAVTGTTGITSFGSQPNRERLIRFTGPLTLTYNATSLILPGTANITTVAGDVAYAVSDGSGNWTVLAYWPAFGFGGQGRTVAVGAAPSSGTITNAIASIRWVPVGQKLVNFTATINIVNNGSGTGAVLLTLPFTPAADNIFAGREVGVSGKMLQARLASGNATMSVFNYDNTYPGATGAVLVISGTYEIQ